MREIKFRVWDNEDKKMHVCGEDCHDAMSFERDGKAYYHNLHNGDGSLGDGYELMQYTGLKDKNGKEIFEGDIVRVGWYDEDCDDWADESVHKVEYCSHEGYPAFDLDPRLQCDANGLAYIDCGGHWHCEVIGNIYETLELLEDN